MRGRRKRRRRPYDPPPDDGLVPVPVWDRMPWGGLRQRFVLRSPEEVKALAEAAMARHDARTRLERWGGNQWGEGWVTRPLLRADFEARAPLLSTDERKP